MKSWICSFGVALIVLFAVSGQSYGSILAQYYVSSTSVINGHDGGGNDAPHGLWTAGDLFGASGAGSSYYDIQDDMLFTQYSDGTATLIGTAINPYASVATISLTYGTFMASIASASDYKKEGGLAYDANLHDFYGIVDGSINFSSGETVNIDHYVGTYKFQFGLGANAKSQTELGGSAWIRDVDGSNGMSSDHWDLNLKFTPVPEPTTLVIWSLLMAAIVPFSRRRIAAV